MKRRDQDVDVQPANVEFELFAEELDADALAKVTGAGACAGTGACWPPYSTLSCKVVGE